MKKNLEKGFTLIELLVVIAIIGVLATVMFVAIDPIAMINKSKDAKVMATLDGMKTAIVSLGENADFDYSNVCSDADITATVSKLSGGACHDSATAWLVQADKIQDSGTVTYCMDSTGMGVEEIAAPVGAGVVVCN